MSDLQAQQPIAQEYTGSRTKLEELQSLRKEIRRSKQALIHSLQDTPEGLRQKTQENQVKRIEQKKIEDVQLPLSVTKGNKKVFVTTAAAEEKEELPRTVRISRKREIEEVFYGDSYHPHSLSPQQRISRNEIVNPAQTRDISQSTILRRVNRNSLTPTKITFCYQNNPSNSVVYIDNQQTIQNQRKKTHLKESIVKEVIVRHSSPTEIRHPSPPHIVYQQIPCVGELKEIDESRRRVVTINQNSLEKYKGEQTTCKIQASGKPCKLCELTRSHLKGVRQMKFTSIAQSAPREVIFVEQQPQILENEPQVHQINNSPEKTKERPYLTTQDKYTCRKSLFGTQNDQQVKRERLNHDFLKSINSRKHVIDTELDKLNSSIHQTPVKVPKVFESQVKYRDSGRTRKKIFQGINLSKSNPFIRIEDGKKPGHLNYSTSKSVCYVRGLPRERTYSQIHGYSYQAKNPVPLAKERHVIVNPGYRSTIMIPTPVYQQRVVTHSPHISGQFLTNVPHSSHMVDNSFTRTLTPVKNQRTIHNTTPIVVERIITPKKQEKEVSPGREVVYRKLDYGSLKERNNFVKKDATTTSSKIQTKLIKIPQFDHMEMSTQVRSWYQIHKREIDYQAERICSYDLIKRYMSEPEISARLYKMMVQKVEPKRWLLLMVDEVYGKLKVRYVPISS